MKNWLKVITMGTMLSASSFVNAAIIEIDFMAEANNNESAWQPLEYKFDLDGFTNDLVLKIEATNSAGAAFAYLDHGAGLGVCGELGNNIAAGTSYGTGNACLYSDDDNVNNNRYLDEMLTFTFSIGGYEIEGFDFNLSFVLTDNHGGGGFTDGDHLGLQGGVVVKDGSSATWELDTDYMKPYTLAYENSPFYVKSLAFGDEGFRSFCDDDSSCEPVPEPSSLGILALCAILLAARKKKLI